MIISIILSIIMSPTLTRLATALLGPLALSGFTTALAGLARRPLAGLAVTSEMVGKVISIVAVALPALTGAEPVNNVIDTEALRTSRDGFRYDWLRCGSGGCGKGR